MSIFNPDDGVPGTGFASSLFGQTGAVAAGQAAQQQAAFSDEALQVLRSNLSPFVNLGAQAGSAAQQLADPESQAEFLASSPLFFDLSQERAQDIFASQAARGKLGSGETAEGVQNSVIELGNSLINNQINRLIPLINIGQSSAARQGAGSVNLLTGMGNTQAAGIVGAQNSLNQGSANAVQLASIIGSAVGGQ